MKYRFEDSLGKLTAEVSNKLGKGLTAKFKENNFEFSPLEWTVLSYLMNEGPQTQIKLSGIIRRNKVFTKRLVDRMELQGLVYRRILILDKRYNEVSITQHGIDHYHKLLPIVEAYLDESCSSLSREELMELVLLLKKILKKI